MTYSFNVEILRIISEILGTLLFWVSLKTENRNRWIFFIVTALICALPALQPIQVGTDFSSYLNDFKRIKVEPFNEAIISDTIGSSSMLFYGLAWILLHFISSQTILYIFCVIIAFIICISTNLIDTKSKTFCFWINMMVFYNLSFNILRQTLALELSFLMIVLVLNKNKKTGFIVLLISCFVHQTAIFAWPIYFILSFKNKNVKRICIGVLSFITVFVSLGWRQALSMMTSLGMLNSYYGGYADTGHGMNRDFYLRLVVLVILLYLNYRQVKMMGELLDDEIIEQNKLFLALYTMAAIIGFTGFYSYFVKRIGTYFELPVIFLFDRILPKVTIKDYGVTYFSYGLLFMLYNIFLFSVS